VRNTMSTREALIQEILKQPESLLRELQHYLAFLVDLQQKESNDSLSTRARLGRKSIFRKRLGHLQRNSLNAQSNCRLRKERSGDGVDAPYEWLLVQ
jgi:hypothetical protein